MSGRHSHWTSGTGFLLAAMGAAIGLGSVWKFPYMVGANGGGLFVLIYLVAAASITVPILIAELMLGRLGQASPPVAMQRVADEVRASRSWRWLGWMTVAAVYLIGTYYSVIGGWVVAYTFEAAKGTFSGANAAQIAELFADFQADPLVVTFWHTVFMALTVIVLMGGVQKGIERASRIMMPTLFIMLMILLGYAALAGDFGTALRFLFVPNGSAITGTTILSAVGLSFFSIGTGMAIMMTYGSYLTREISLVRSAIKIAVSVPIVALSMGLAIFPVVFANGLDPAEGPGLVFVTLPVAFGQMPGGWIFGVVFFLLATFAALTSAIAGIEPVVAWAANHRGMSRTKAAIIAGAVAWVLGLATVFSFNIWADVHPLAAIEKFATMTWFDLLDFVTSSVMLPLANILICVFAGWIMPEALLRAEVGATPSHARMFAFWRLTLRFFAPIPIAVILISGLA